MNEVRRALRSLVELSPPPEVRYSVAVRAALSVAVPYGALELAGYADIGLQTAAGTFTALYVARAPAKDRAKVLPLIALGLLVCAGLGVLLAPWHWAFAVGLVVVAVVSAALCFAYRIGAPGPVFFVLIYGLSANITSVADGERVNPPLVFLAAVTAGALFSYLLALVPLLLRSARAQAGRPLRELLPPPWLDTGEQILVLRIAIAATIGTAISIIWLDPIHAYWTVAASVAVTGLTASRAHALGRGLHRTLGTVLGAGLYLLLVPLGTDPIVLVPLLAALSFVIELAVVRNYGLALTFITPLVLLITAAAIPNADVIGSALERVVDTAAGAALAMLTGILHRR